MEKTKIDLTTINSDEVLSNFLGNFLNEFFLSAYVENKITEQEMNIAQDRFLASKDVKALSEKYKKSEDAVKMSIRNVLNAISRFTRHIYGTEIMNDIDSYPFQRSDKLRSFVRDVHAEIIEKQKQ